VKASLGGAIFIQESEINKKNTDAPGKYKIADSSFTSCGAFTGGAIYADNPIFLTIKRTEFNQNKALRYDQSYYKGALGTGAGGALYYKCDAIY
jgi:hypothetical protein